MEGAAIQVSLREAKAQLSRLADAAHCGHTLLLTRYGQPWARLLPPDQSRRRQPSCGRFLVEALGSDPTYLLRHGQLNNGLLSNGLLSRELLGSELLNYEPPKRELGRGGFDPRLQQRLIQWARSDVAPPSGRVGSNGQPSRGVLIDGNVLLWWWGFPMLVPDNWFRWLRSPDRPVYVSMASLQQLAEAAHGRQLPWLKEPLQCCQALLETDGFQCLPVEVRHLQGAQRQLGPALVESLLQAQARLDALELLSPGACLAAANQQL